MILEDSQENSTEGQFPARDLGSGGLSPHNNDLSSNIAGRRDLLSPRPSRGERDGSQDCDAAVTDGFLTSGDFDAGLVAPRTTRKNSSS